MTSVTWPYIDESFKRALSEVIRPYFGSGGTFLVGGIGLYLYKCELGFQVEKVREESQNPRITFTGTRIGNEQRFKCENAAKQLVEVYRLELLRTVFVSVPKALVLAVPPYSDLSPRAKSSYQTVDTVWGQLLAVANDQAAAFRQRGITNVTLASVPIEMPDTDYWIGRGIMSAIVQVSTLRP